MRGFAIPTLQNICFLTPLIFAKYPKRANAKNLYTHELHAFLRQGISKTYLYILTHST